MYIIPKITVMIFKTFTTTHFIYTFQIYTMLLHDSALDIGYYNILSYLSAILPWCSDRFFLGLSICRRFGTKCAGCAQGISPNDLVRRARSKVFHLNCFTCMMCNKQLSTGEELYIIDENKFVCKEDYLSSSNGKDANLLSGE